MILLYIQTASKKLAGELPQLLVSEKLALEVMTVQPEVFSRHGKQREYLLLFRTKALLFGKINARLREHCGASMPLIWSLPLLNADAAQRDELMHELQDA